jgi:endonuclease-8
VEFDGPVLELITEGRRRFDQRLAALGPDVLADEFDYETFLRRLRADDPTRGFGDALLDQRIVAGIGNAWKCEGLWLAQIDPWRRTGEVGDDEARHAIEVVRPAMLESARTAVKERRQAYDKAGRPCPRCGAVIRARGQGDDNRTTFWCPGCQR